jgi:hypothetical protein
MYVVDRESSGGTRGWVMMAVKRGSWPLGRSAMSPPCSFGDTHPGIDHLAQIVLLNRPLPSRLSQKHRYWMLRDRRSAARSILGEDRFQRIPPELKPDRSECRLSDCGRDEMQLELKSVS